MTELKKKFTIEITSPDGRGGYDGGETILRGSGGPGEWFGVIGPFIASFPGYKALNEGDEVEITIAVVKKKWDQLSNLAIGDCGSIDGKRFIVCDRSPEDRASGVTDIQWEEGGEETFVWDRSDPMVLLLGRGKRTVQIEFPVAPKGAP